MVVTTAKKAARRGFSLVELVIVVLVIGIIAAIAAPKMMNTATDARTNATQQSLRTLRSAIEIYKAKNGSYPPAGTLAAALTTGTEIYLQGPFPAPQIGANKTNDVAASTNSPITAPSGTQGWIYNATTGEIRVNDATYITW